jgi:hypothetical protein
MTALKILDVSFRNTGLTAEGPIAVSDALTTLLTS